MSAPERGRRPSRVAAIRAAVGGGIAAAVIAGGASAPAAKQTPCTAGLVDRTFGSNGWAKAPVGSEATLATVLKDGRIAVVGRGDQYDSITLARLSADGAPDAAFGSIPIRAPGARISLINQAIGDRRGRLLLIGGVGRAPAFSRPLIMRRRADGTPDPAFSKDGAVVVGTGHGVKYGMFHAAAELADGRIVAVGSAGRRMLVARFAPDGALDRSFGRAGIVVVPPARSREWVAAELMRITSGGDAVVVGASGLPLSEPFLDYRLAMARIGRNGSVAAQSLTAVGRKPDEAELSVNGLVADRDATWIVGSAYTDAITLIRLDRRGAPDPNFGDRGAAVRRIGNVAEITVAGAARGRPDGVLVATTVAREVEITEPDGDHNSTTRMTPAIFAFDAKGRRRTNGCSSRPALPEGAVEAELLDTAPTRDGMIAVGWAAGPDDAPAEPVVLRLRQAGPERVE